MKCDNHPKKEADGICTICGNSFCSDCLIKVKRKNICEECANQELNPEYKPGRSAAEQKPIIFQQQQQQQSAPQPAITTTQSKTNSFDTIKWIIAALMFLLAIGAYAKSPLSSLILVVLGIYWIPPIMAWVQKLVFEKTGISLPRWFRVGISLFLFFVAVLISPKSG